jgi:DNA-binding XRE family transcriptional regulator
VKKPLSNDIPVNPQTVGEHIRKVRIERGLSQKEVAAIIRVCEDTITGWENGRSKPQIRYIEMIEQFVYK